MSKKMRELMAQLKSLQEAADALINKEGVTTDEINEKLAEIRALKAKIEAQRLLDESQHFNNDGVEVTESPAEEKEKVDDKAYLKAFLNVIRGKATSADREVIKAFDLSSDEDGGLLLPADIQTKVNEFKRELYQLDSLVNIENVTAPSGHRVYEKVATMTPFVKITDLDADITDMGTPQFVKVDFTIEDYAGYMAIPNDLLDDADQNLIDYIARWIARKSTATRNGLILDILTDGSPTAFGNEYNKIKKALNVSIDPALAADAVILTNQDGFQFLDTLEDGTGKPLLQPDVTNPSAKLFAGKRVVVVGNSILKTTGTATKLAPIIIGNLKEAITIYQRQGLQIDSTKEGGTAFLKNRTEVRAIERLDVKAVDTDAFVYGTIDVSAAIA